MSTPHPRFHLLSVADVTRETGTAVSIAFNVPEALTTDYAFAPGQYLTLRATIDGQDVRRSYSICSAPAEGELRVAVKQVNDGLFSRWVNETVRVGQTLQVMTPTGRFGLGASVPEGGVYVAFVAGSGITPVLSILQSVLGLEPASRFFLFYGNRTGGDVLFRETLTELKDRYLQRLSVLYVLSREEQDVPILNGHLDGGKVRALLTTMVPAATIDHAFICGPAGMIADVDTALRELGIAEGKIHVERFVSAEGGRPRRPPAAVMPEAPPAHMAALIVDGKRRAVPVAAGEAILDAALRAGVDLPFACRGGMCASCRARLVEGTATMAVNYSLEPWELTAGFVLTCQAHPTSPRVVVDFDQV